MNLQILKVAQYLPYEIIDKILSYDKRIKYKKGKFINQIYPNDERYNLLKEIILKKIYILTELKITNFYQEKGDVITTITTYPHIANIKTNKFYVEFCFDNLPNVGLCYDYYWAFDYFEICYFDMRNNGWKQIRTIIN